MPNQRVPFPDKNVERVVNMMFTELYERSDFTSARTSFSVRYAAAITVAEKVDVLAEYLKLK
jgi:hypothetical protein